MLKKSSGGVDSSTIIIVVSILLVGAIIGLFLPIGSKDTGNGTLIKRYTQGEKVNPISERVTDAYYTKANIDTAVCGIKVFSPLPGQKVGFPLEISGYVNGCNWVPFLSNVGTLEIRDQEGVISPVVILPIEVDDGTLPAYFKIKVSPSINPRSNSGVLIFKNEKNSNEIVETFQVPIIF